MNLLLCTLCMGLAITIVILIIKIRLMQKSADEIHEGIKDRLTSDTNTLIDISSNDSHMRRLAGSMNGQLQELRRERQRYAKGNAELSGKITNISHDLRTPLTAICGYLELLEREDILGDARRYLGMIKNRTDALKQLTGELFFYSVAVSGEKELELGEVVLNDVLEESIAAYYGAFTEKGMVPYIKIPDAAVGRRLNREALYRIFENIISNAIKYSAGDFSVELSEDGRIFFSNRAAGLDAVQVGRMFDRFFTIESGDCATGLGLSIAKQLTEQMGGTILALYEDGYFKIEIYFEEKETA